MPFMPMHQTRRTTRPRVGGSLRALGDKLTIRQGSTSGFKKESDDYVVSSINYGDEEPIRINDSGKAAVARALGVLLRPATWAEPIRNCWPAGQSNPGSGDACMPAGRSAPRLELAARKGVAVGEVIGSVLVDRATQNRGVMMKAKYVFAILPLGALETAFHAWALAVALVTIAVASAHADSSLRLVHVHGMSYSADGETLMVSSHDGLAMYAGGRWSKAEGPAHDYMGLSVTHDALYSSGHPAKGSELPDPVGVMKSRDGGKTWQQIGLTGEADFHVLAASYFTNAVYVSNKAANTLMSQRGIYYTLTDGIKWQRAAANGLGRWLHSLAVHPTDAAVVAAGTDEGLYISRDSAESFERLVGGMVTAEGFDLDGRHLWFSTYAGKAVLARIALQAGGKAEEVPIAVSTDDAVAYIAQNPVRRSEIAVSTFQRNVFISKDQGRTWTQVARDGATSE